MNKLVLSLVLVVSASSMAQPVAYTTANAHSHNDYEQPVPLYTAYNEMFGSIEADIFWHNGELLVAHTTEELAKRRTLEALYLKPLQGLVEKHRGYIYADTTRRLQFMIDLKTNGDTTLGTLVALLQKYPTLTQCGGLQFTISGNRPDITTYTSYPAYIHFDGELDKEYPAAALSRIVMLSAPMKAFTKWEGKGAIPALQRDTLQQFIDRAHALHKTVRFWGAPDFPEAWKQLMALGVDYINTDHIPQLSRYFNKRRQQKVVR